METHKLSKRRVVLIVEDEPLLLLHAQGVVEDAGYEALTAHSADEAIALLQRRTDVGVVFTDVYLSGSMDGMKLARAIRDRWPPIALVITSGRAMLSSDDMPASSVFLSKPYAERQLTHALQAAAGVPILRS